jgi:hypothetical protein
VGLERMGREGGCMLRYTYEEREGLNEKRRSMLNYLKEITLT